MLKSPHIVYLRNNEEQAEGLIRNALIKYPTSNIVVIDNGSTDNTVSIVKKLAEKHKRIILMSNNQQLTDKMSND